MNVLIVDDEKLIAQSVRENIIEITSNCYLAYDGLSALEVFHKEKIDIIISDINMPRMNGIEFALKVRETNKEIPICFHSGNKQNLNTYKNELQEIGEFQFAEKGTDTIGAIKSFIVENKKNEF